MRLGREGPEPPRRRGVQGPTRLQESLPSRRGFGDMDQQQQGALRPPTSAHGIRLRQVMMGQRLRTTFEAVVDEPLPEDFLDLLNQIEMKGPEAP